MLRSQVVQGFLDLYDRPRYLEVGVHAGETFHALRATKKVAVDPAFLFDTRAAAVADATATFHPVPSDDYFLRLCPPDERFDVVFLDGLHTFEQTLRDLMNALARTRPDSVIVIDDVLPSGYAASVREIGEFARLHSTVPGTPDAWMGDVYRLVWFIAVFMPMWSYATIAENHGQLVLWREPRREPAPDPEMTVEAVSRISYADVVLRPAVFRVTPFADVAAAVAAWRAAFTLATRRAADERVRLGTSGA